MNVSQFLNIVHGKVPAKLTKESFIGEVESPGLAEVSADHSRVLDTPVVVTDWAASHQDIPRELVSSGETNLAWSPT